MLLLHLAPFGSHVPPPAFVQNPPKVSGAVHLNVPSDCWVQRKSVGQQTPPHSGVGHVGDETAAAGVTESSIGAVQATPATMPPRLSASRLENCPSAEGSIGTVVSGVDCLRADALARSSNQFPIVMPFTRSVRTECKGASSARSSRGRDYLPVHRKNCGE